MERIVRYTKQDFKNVKTVGLVSFITKTTLIQSLNTTHNTPYINDNQIRHNVT
jgi:hypothetical protein